MPDPCPRVPCRQPSLPGCFRHSYNAPLSKTRSSLPWPVRHPEPSGKTLLQAPTPSFHVSPPSGFQCGQTHPCPRRPDPEPKGRTTPNPRASRWRGALCGGKGVGQSVDERTTSLPSEVGGVLSGDYQLNSLLFLSVYPLYFYHPF